MKPSRTIIPVVAIILLLISSVVGANETPERVYSGVDRAMAMQATLATLQEFGFVIMGVDTVQWTVKSARYIEKHRKQLGMNFSIEKTAKGVLVQAELVVNEKPVQLSHIAYRNFFQRLGKAVSRIRKTRD